MTETGQYKNGADVHFDYTERPLPTPSKKKKKRLANQTPRPHAHLNNPEDDYPTSRVIKQAPNGDVIVELLDEPRPYGDAAIWDSSSIKEQENLKGFWESLDHELKLRLVKIDKKLIMELFRRENGHKHDHHHHHHHHHSVAHHPPMPPSGCTCKFCGRRSNVIEDELDQIYDNHFDDIIDFIHEVRDINDLNALPGLLFGGFHMLEEEHRASKRLAKSPSPPPPPPPAPVVPPQLTSEEQRVFKALLDPKLFEALENLDFDKLKDINTDINRANLIQKAGSLREIFRDFHRADKVHLEKGVSLLQSMGKLFNVGQDQAGDGGDATQTAANLRQFSQGLLLFAEDLLKNDGHSFIEMMELLLELRTVREDLLKLAEEDGVVSVPLPEEAGIREIGDGGDEGDEADEADEDEDEDDEDEDEDEDEEDEEDEEEEDEDEDIDEGDDVALCVSDTELEILEEEKMQEIRRLFLIQVIKLFQERLKNAYKEKLAEDRTQQLIQELEAEETAKKERELKKQKQKEKQKEKKRLLQQAKEEERKRLEQEKAAEEEEALKRQEAQRAEQKRRKEEKQQRREEEKRKRIEELKRKEEEHRQRVEAQQKREEEAKRQKEERKKAAEQENLRREEEKKQKDAQRQAQRLEKERERQERERREAEEEAQELQRQAQEVAKQFQQEIATNVSTTSFPFSAEPLPIASLRLLLSSGLGVSGPPVNVSLGPNHLLDQLYSLAQSTTFDMNQPTAFDTMNQLFSSIGLGKLSPLPPPGLGATMTSSPWSATPVNTTSSLFTPFGEPFAGGAPAPSSQRNLIWSQPSTRQPLFSRQIPSGIGSSLSHMWNLGLNGGTPNLAPRQLSLPPQPMVSLVAGGDAEVIQLATHNAYQMLSQKNQLEFGMAPIQVLFNQVRTLVGASLTLGQFLTLIRTLQLYQFDVVYDDVGTVTHVKVSSSRGPSGLAQVPPAAALLPLQYKPEFLDPFASPSLW